MNFFSYQVEMELFIDRLIKWLREQKRDIQRKHKLYKYHQNWIRSVYTDPLLQDITLMLPSSLNFLHQAHPVQFCGDWYWSDGILKREEEVPF